MPDDMKDAPAKPSPMEGWITRTTAILAVLAALSSGQWGTSNLKAILEQGKVNDTWAYYQSKSIKGHIATDTGELAKALHADPEIVDKLEKEAKKADEDKSKAQAEAEGYQKTRDTMVQRSFWFEISFACIQLGVVICTIAAAKRSKGLWATALAFGVAGLLVFLNGRLLIFQIDANPITEGMTKSLEAKPPK
jgi:hypothetical protein